MEPDESWDGICHAAARILTIGAGVAGVFAKSHADLEAPDLQIHFMPLSAVGPGQGLHAFNGVTASIAQLRPESRGHLRIKNGDAAENPAILANYLDSQTDRDVLMRGMHMMRRISSQDAWARVMKREVAPGPEAASEEDLMAFARRWVRRFSIHAAPARWVQMRTLLLMSGCERTASKACG